MFSKHFQIGDKWIGYGEPTFLVAEIGLNHNGDVELAKKLISKAKDCGADAVKFQKRDEESIFIKKVLDAPYNNWFAFGKTYRDHRKALELSKEDYQELKDFTEKLGLIFFATSFDINSANFLETLDVPVYKIASPDVTFLPLVECVAKKGKPVFMSTGMSTLGEVKEAVEIIEKYNDELVLLQCTSTYPSKSEEINLKVMETLKKEFNCLVGYSGHASAIIDGTVASVLGACVVEKHFTLDRTMKGPDHAVSLEPIGLQKMIRDIRGMELAVGDGVKRIVEREFPIREKYAKSIVAKQTIEKGQTITREMLTCKSPALGLKPNRIEEFVGRIAKKNISEDEYLKVTDIE